MGTRGKLSSSSLVGGAFPARCPICGRTYALTDNMSALSATVNVTATDPSGIASITYNAAGARTIGSTTALATGGPTTFTVPVALNGIGNTTVRYTARDALRNVSATGTILVKLLATQPTTLSITSAPSLAQGATTVSAKLLASGTSPVAGQTVTFTAGGASASAITDANGVATATLTLAPGTHSLTAAFAGTSAYLPSSARPQTLTVFGATQFVIWGGNPQAASCPGSVSCSGASTGGTR